MHEFFCFGIKMNLSVLESTVRRIDNIIHRHRKRFMMMLTRYTTLVRGYTIPTIGTYRHLLWYTTVVVQKLTTQKLTNFTKFLDIRKIGENMKKFIDTLSC